MNANVLWSAVALWGAGCGSVSAKPDAPSGGGGDDGGAVQGTGNAHLGGHALGYYKLNASTASSLSTPALDTAATGSTLVVSVGRGKKMLFAPPTDTKGNAYAMRDTVHAYIPAYPDSGTALYTVTSARGGAGLEVTTTTGSSDEITMAAVEVADSAKIQDVAWNELTAPPLASGTVTTDGPATLIAFWWGDGFPGTPQKAVPDGGFTVIDSNAQDTDSFVQCAVATRTVTGAGTYSVTWTPTPSQGAQLWLVAVE